MSSSRASTQQAEAHTEPFTYTPYGDGAEPIEGDAAKVSGNPKVNMERILEQREKRGYDRGLQEGEDRARKNYDQNLAALRTSVAKALEEFKGQRETYFGRVEPQVVQLALGIARKILHREAQMDPLLLAGMVHVALEKIDQGTRVRLHAHPDETHYWNRYFAEFGSLPKAPEIIGDATLRHGECVLETEVGNTQISLETQLKEIEQGFFDLLEQRPQVR
ncbi:MAG: FliH/SctL family protein [Candidatus Acidiferrum sp.]|jgi:flagellar assembly protein FliH